MFGATTQMTISRSILQTTNAMYDITKSYRCWPMKWSMGLRCVCSVACMCAWSSGRECLLVYVIGLLSNVKRHCLKTITTYNCCWFQAGYIFCCLFSQSLWRPLRSISECRHTVPIFTEFLGLVDM